MKRKQNWIWVLIALLIVAICLMFLPIKAGASDGLPPSVEVFEVDDHTCVLYEFKNGVGGTEAELECFCPCEELCVEPSVTPKETHTPQPTPTDKPQPTPTEKPDPTPKPTKTEKPKCNRGLGNGSENCDPGNSGGKPGKAGEDNE